MERLFPHHYHTLYKVSTLVPENYNCQAEGCPDLATNLTLVNVWGSVCPIYTCRSCFEKHNGTMVDELPELKKEVEI